MEMQQQIQQPNREMQLMEQIRERAHLLEHHVQQQNTQQEQQQRQQTVMRQRTSRDQLLKHPVQQDENIEQKWQQRPQIPMGQGVLLDFFEPSSQRLPPPGPQETTDDFYEDEESRSCQSKEEASNQMHQQHPVDTILHSKLESNGQQKYLIRWMGDFKDSWQPIRNVTSDIIDDFNKRKIQEMANKHLAKV